MVESHPGSVGAQRSACPLGGVGERRTSYADRIKGDPGTEKGSHVRLFTLSSDADGSFSGHVGDSV